MPQISRLYYFRKYFLAWIWGKAVLNNLKNDIGGLAERSLKHDIRTRSAKGDTRAWSAGDSDQPPTQMLFGLVTQFSTWGRKIAWNEEPKVRGRLWKTRPCTAKPLTLFLGLQCVLLAEMFQVRHSCFGFVLAVRSLQDKISLSSWAVVFFCRREPSFQFGVFRPLYSGMYSLKQARWLVSISFTKQLLRAFVDVLKIDSKGLIAHNVPTSENLCPLFSCLNLFFRQKLCWLSQLHLYLVFQLESDHEYSSFKLRQPCLSLWSGMPFCWFSLFVCGSKFNSS